MNRKTTNPICQELALGRKIGYLARYWLHVYSTPSRHLGEKQVLENILGGDKTDNCRWAIATVNW